MFILSAFIAVLEASWLGVFKPGIAMVLAWQ
jgi:hypothetical protein